MSSSPNSSPNNQWPMSGLGLFQNFFQNRHLMDLTAMSQSPDQFMRGFARWQSEVQGLMARRAQAYMDLPNRMSQCRTQQDLMEEQQRFWQTCFEQYSSSSRQIMAAWAQMFQMPVGPNVTTEVRGHDYLSFPETRGVGGQGTPATPSSDKRKVA